MFLLKFQHKHIRKRKKKNQFLFFQNKTQF